MEKTLLIYQTIEFFKQIYSFTILIYNKKNYGTMVLWTILWYHVKKLWNYAKIYDTILKTMEF